MNKSHKLSTRVFTAIIALALVLNGIMGSGLFQSIPIKGAPEDQVETNQMDENLKEIDFTSKRLIVKGEKDALSEEPVIAEFDGVFLVQYETAEDAEAAYNKLVPICESVEVDSVMGVAEGETEGEPTETMTEEENPFKEAEETKVDKVRYDAAVIDTGANSADKILSVLGDDGSDSHGHGQKMIDTIKEYAPDSKVLSIKALGDNGTGDISAVYAAIKLAISEDVKLINLSISALATEDSFIIEEAIKEAREKGIVVVGAAGNNGIDAKFTVPGRIDDAIIVGTPKKNSNTGDTVDYIVDAESTSFASAVVAGLIASDTLKNYEIKDKLIIMDVENNDDEPTTDEPTTDEPTDPNTDFEVQFGGGGGSGSGSIGSGGFASDPNWAYFYWDRGTENAGTSAGQPYVYTRSNLNNDANVSNADMYFWLDKMTQYIVASSPYSYVNNLTAKSAANAISYGDTSGMYLMNTNSLYADGTDWDGRVAVVKSAMKKAYQNALREDPTGKSARIIGVAWEYVHPGELGGGTDYNMWTFSDMANKNDDFWSLFGARYPNVSSWSGTPSTNYKAESYWGLYGSSGKAGKNNAWTGKPTQEHANRWNEFIKSANAPAASNQNAATYSLWTSVMDTSKFVQSSSWDWKIHFIAVTDNFPGPENDPFLLKLSKTNGGNGPSLANAVFAVDYYEGDYSSIGALPSKATAHWEYKTDANGLINFANPAQFIGTPSDPLIVDDNNVIAVPYGTLVIYEKTAPTGYALGSGYTMANGTSVESGQKLLIKHQESEQFMVKGTNNLNNSTIQMFEPSINGGFKIQKWDENDHSKDGEGDALDMTTKYRVVNISGYPIAYGNKSIANDGVVYEFTTDNKGYYESKANELPYGKYRVEEITPPVGFKNDADNTKNIVNITSEGQIVDLTAETDGTGNPPFKGGVIVEKKDIAGYTEGDASLAGIKFAVINSSKDTVRVGGTDFAKGTVVRIITTNAEGKAQTENNLLPYGTYTVTELRQDATIAVGDVYQGSSKLGSSIYANSSYLWKSASKTDSIRKDGTMISAEYTAENAFVNPPVPGAGAIVKVDSQNGTVQGDADISGIKFALVNDSNAAIQYNGTTIPKGNIVTILTTDASGKVGTADRALPYGTYTLYELKSTTTAKANVAWNTNLIGNANDVYANKAGYLWKNNSHRFSLRTDGQVETANFDNMPVEGGITLRKVDEDGNKTGRTTNKPQGDALIGGSSPSEISIYNISEKTVVNKDGAKIATGKNAIDVTKRTGYSNNYLVQKITTNAEGVASTAATDLPYGTYVAIETKAPQGYILNEDWYVVFQVRQQGVVINVNTSEKVAVKRGDGSLSGWTSAAGTIGNTVKQALTQEIIRGGVNIYKINEELKKAQNEGDSTLEGNTFNIVNASLQDVYVEGKWYGKVADKFADGKSDKTDWTKNSVSRVTNISRDELIAAKNAVSGNGAVVKTLTTNAEGFDKTALDTLPYGTYYIYEAETNSSMRLDEDWVIRVEIREDNKMVDTKSVPCQDPIVRGDLYFTKVNEDGVRRPNTPFLIAALDADGKIIESHVIVTDSSGIASTAFIYNTVEQDNMLETTQVERKSSVNTNGFDKYVKKNADGSYSVTAEGERLLASGEAAKYGVWFSQGLDVNTGKIVKNSKAPADDERGALYYGTYQIFEIQCKENADLGEDLLISKVFTIRNKDQEYNATKDLMHEEDRNVNEKQLRYADAFVDLEVLLASKAKDVVTDSQVTFANANVVLSDTISFSNVKATSTYKWIVDFVETESGNVLSEVVIDRFNPEKTNNDVQTTNQPNFAFTITTDGKISPAKNPDGTVNKSYTGTPIVTTTGNVDTTGLDGKSISVVVYLYEYITGYDFDSEDDYKEFEALNFITSHNVDRKDENQKVYIPKMETTATDIFTKDHVGTKYNIGVDYDKTSKVDAIVDKVVVNNLCPREKYMLVEYLWDATENKRFGEEQITYSWYSDREPVNHIEEWSIEMAPFKVDSKDFADKTLVVMEELWRVTDAGEKIDDIPVITHVSKVDEKQSVHYIDIDTELTDEFTNDHVGTVVEKVTLTDKVELKNLLKNMEYVIKGKLVYQADCEDANGNKHKAGDPVDLLEGSVTEVTYKAAKTGDATVYITYVVDSRVLEGIDVVSTEYAYHNDVLIDKHVDLEDKDQTVEFPKLRTKAADIKTGDTVGTVMEDGTIIDTVQLWNLIEGQEYTVDGTLRYQEDGSLVEEAVSEPYTFVATKEQTEYCEVEIKFTGLDTTKLAGRSLVAFEKLYHPNAVTGDPVEITKHEDLYDKDQTVHYPSIRTMAVDSRTGDQVGSIFGKFINGIRIFFGADVLEEDETEIIDTVYLGNLVPGETYTISGVLMDQDTGKLLADKEIRQSVAITVGEGTITASNGEKTTVTKWDEKNNSVTGTVDVTFRLGSEEITDKTVVVFEKLIHNDVEVNKHEDINDRAQFVNLIDVDSEAHDANTGNHVGDVPGSTDETATIVEKFFMKKLVNNEDYKVNFALLVKEESEIQGKPIYLAEDGTFTEDRTKAIQKDVEFDALAEKEHSYWRVDVSNGTVLEADNHDDAVAKYDAYVATLSESEKAEITSALIYLYTEMVPDTEAFSAGAELEVEFTVGSDSVAGYTIVVVADVYHNDVIVATHSDWNDEDESVHYPKGWTTAHHGVTLDHVGTLGEHQVIVDRAYYQNLIPGHEYEIHGHLMNRNTGEVYKDANGNEIRGFVKFTPKEGEESGYQDIKFEFDDANLAGVTLVAFEDLYYNGVHIGKEMYYDINNDAQAVHYPKISTTFVDKATGSHMGAILEADAIRTWVDRVDIENIPNGTYSLDIELMERSTDEKGNITAKAALDKEGKPITNTVEFTVDDTFEGFVDVEVTVDIDDIEGKTFVAYETLRHEPSKEPVAEHKDPEDEAQTIYVPKIRTVFMSRSTNSKLVAISEKETLVDTITYENVVPGEEVTFVLKLANSETGELLKDKDGNEYTATVPVKFTDTKGEVEVAIEVDTVELPAMDIVAFERMMKGDTLVAKHEDLNDVDQTVKLLKIETEATSADGKKSVYPLGKTEINDKVIYSNLTPGEVYRLKGWIVDKETGKTVSTESIAMFKPEKADGDTTLKFVVDVTELKGHSLVAFEELYDKDGNLIAVHKDIDDENQTVLVKDVQIGTTATSKEGDKAILGTKNATIIDTVSYKGFDKDEKVVLKTWVVDKTDNGKVVSETVETKATFGPEGEVKVTITLDTTNLEKHELVVFEEVYDEKGNLVAEHKDINDKAQTVTVKTKTTVQTGVETAAPIGMALAIILAALSIGVGIVYRRKYSK